MAVNPAFTYDLEDASRSHDAADSAQVRLNRLGPAPLQAPAGLLQIPGGPQQTPEGPLQGEALPGPPRHRQAMAGQLMPRPPKSPTLRTDKVTVFIRVVFLKIGEIDTVKECFTAEAFIQAKWREARFDGLTDIKSSEVSWDEYWNPKLYIDNTVGEQKETLWRAVVFNARQEAFVYERRRVKGVFLENMELNEFPFDTQDLTITLLSERTNDELELEEDHSEISSINVQSFVDEQEWRLYNKVVTLKSHVDKVFEGSTARHPSLGSRCHASRRIGFYIWNIYFVMCIICTMAFTTFAVSPALSQNRLQLTFILLLTAVTFKFAVLQILPRISYLTYLDYYILSSMGVNVVLCVWHAIIAAVLPKFLAVDFIGRIDSYFVAAMGTLYVLVHVSFFLFVYFKVLRKRRIHLKREIEHKEKIKNQNSLSVALAMNMKEF